MNDTPMRPLIEPPKRPPTPSEAEAIAMVHEIAASFDRGDCTTADVRRATKGKQRWLATRFTAKDDPRFPALMRLLDALIAEDQGIVHTDQGPFPLDDLIAARMRVTFEDGREVISFPIRQPWVHKPDDTDPVGIPGEPVYRRKEERCAEQHGFSVTPPAAAQSHEAEWWELQTETTMEGATAR